MPEHPAEERDGASERAVGHRPELPGPGQQVREVKREPARDQERRRIADPDPRLNESAYRQYLRARVAGDGEPSEEVGTHRKARMLSRERGRNTIAPMSSFPSTRQSFPLGSGGAGTFYSLPQLEKDGLGSDLPAARQPPRRPGVAPAELRRQAGQGRRRARAGRLEAAGGADGGGAVRRRADRAPGLHRRAAARGPGRDALGRGPAEARIRRSSSRSSRSTWSSTTPCRSTSGPRRTPCA